MTAGSDAAVGRAVELLGWVVLLALLAALMWLFGILVGTGIDDARLGRVYGQFDATLPGIELTILPFAAIAAARLRLGADRIPALRASRVGFLLPLFMAASLFGLGAYLVWTWGLTRTEYEPEPEFGRLRWLGIVLIASFTWAWMPLFPRITATLAGMIAGPALFAIVGYTFFGACMQADDAVSFERMVIQAFLVSIPATIVWALGALWLSTWARHGAETHHPFHLLHFAGWSGLITLTLALFGTLNFTAC